MGIKKIIFLSILLLATAYLFWPSDEKVVFCDVGQGDGALIISGNFQMLVDVGPDNHKMVDCLGKHLPFWDKTVEVIVISHDDRDHNGGLEEVKKFYNVQNIYTNNLRKNDIIRYKSISFEILSPDDNWSNDNDNSVVGRLDFGGREFLFLGDISSEVEQKMVWRKARLYSNVNAFRVVKISHHGSNTGTSDELLNSLKINEVVISVGSNNKFGHPAKETLDKLLEKKIRTRRTDLEGEIVY